ncbi:hypothetical protein HanPI659440_Chr08g0292571 [Helianthus annuus]|nr:hypothetical protein HanPI659440_Chr08g0292571 [Helianthus annuus]
MIKKTRIKLGWTLETHLAFLIIVECYVYLFGTINLFVSSRCFRHRLGCDIMV